MSDRTCGTCAASLRGKRLTAKYCSRKCKQVAIDGRRAPRSRPARTLPIEVRRRAKRKRRALLAGAAIFQVTERDWRRLCQRHDNRCFYCGAREPLTMDHVIPILRRGPHSIGNLIPACVSCNSVKAHRTIMEWRLGRRVPRGEVSSHPLETTAA